MGQSTSRQVILGVSLGTLVFLMSAWSIQWLWRAAGERDRSPSRGNMAEQLMHRKSSAMQDILDGMVRGDLRRVSTAAKKMKDYGGTIEWYLSYTEYDKLGEEFRTSVNALQAASERRDVESAKEAVLKLERSCIECHMVMNKRNMESRALLRIPDASTSTVIGHIGQSLFVTE